LGVLCKSVGKWPNTEWKLRLDNWNLELKEIFEGFKRPNKKKEAKQEKRNELSPFLY
jgi:hypothetical protein